jgi:hypothetical protein
MVHRAQDLKNQDVIQDINSLLQERRQFFEEIIELCKWNLKLNNILVF